MKYCIIGHKQVIVLAFGPKIYWGSSGYFRYRETKKKKQQKTNHLTFLSKSLQDKAKFHYITYITLHDIIRV